ncbi:MAG TPA: transglutaminase domain-containing protein, partial [Nitriliruptorales bacterium]
MSSSAEGDLAIRSTTQLQEEEILRPDQVADPDTDAPRLGEAGDALAPGTDEGAPPRPEDGEPEEELRPPIDPLRTSLAASLGGAGAGWMLGGAFDGYLPEIAGVVAAVVAGTFAGWTYRLRRPTGPQLFMLPGAIVLAALFTVVTTGVEVTQIPDLVVESLRQGGLALPPVAFDPGWRVLVVLISAFVTITGATTAVSLDKARIGVAIPGAVALVTILLQPAGDELVAVAVALVLGIAGLAVAYGAELARDGTMTEGGFEVRRLARAGGIALLLVAALVALGQIGFLFPEADTNQVVPPQRPEAPPPPRDRVLFSVESADTQPWRVGTLDVYRDGAWMTPPFDPAALVDLVPVDGDVAAALGPRPFPGALVEPEETIEVTFTLEDVEGRVVPLLAGTTHVDPDFGRLEFYPRTQTVQVDGRQAAGTTYTVTAAKPPSGAQLAEAPDPDPTDPVIAQFLEALEPGPVAATLLAEADALDVPLYEKLQFVRTRFYDKVIAAGKGEPLDVGAQRIDQMLQEAEANPYEIVAGEALLARMAGVPARLGFGYFGGDVPAGGDGSIRELRPKHGAMWLEAYFEGHGWVPVMGRPPRAKSSLSDDQQEPDPFVQATDEIAARVYVPTAGRSLAPLYILVRFWLARVLPVVLVAVLLIGGYPAILKRIRRWRRRRWANRQGPRARIAVAYADIRDIANDLNIGHPSLTPLEFQDVTQPDPEHRELAWLVTRVMWGDLVRDARDADADAAEEVAAAFRKRFLAGQP